jgi:hypothetical protein
MEAASGIVLLHTWPAPVSSHLKQVIQRLLDSTEFTDIGGL